MDTEPARSKSLALILGLLILLGVAATALIRIDSKRRDIHMQEASSNARSFGFALFEFETEYGSYPNSATAALVTKNLPSHGYDLTGTSSNAAFRQLIAADITHSEHFYARIPGTTKPDYNTAPGEALKKGEVAFTYISGLTTHGTNPLTPLVLTPLIPGTTKFDPKPFKGKAVILHIDNSVRTYDIAKDGHVYDKGINLLSVKHPIWKGKAPDIRYPDL